VYLIKYFMRIAILLIIFCFLLLKYTLSQWTRCAIENGTCNFSGIKIVRFGNNDGFNFIESNNSVRCNTNYFGIPSSSPNKFCDYADSNFIFCSNEGAQCLNLEYYPSLIKYTNGLLNVYRRINYAEGIFCNDSSFGVTLSPHRGKYCYKSLIPFDDEYDS
jgi:hypothetical protein